MSIHSTEFRFALYVFLCDYHSGQWSRGYRLLSKISAAWHPRINSECMSEIRETDEYLALELKFKNKV